MATRKLPLMLLQIINFDIRMMKAGLFYSNMMVNAAFWDSCILWTLRTYDLSRSFAREPWHLKCFLINKIAA